MRKGPPGWNEVSLGDICEFKYGRSLPAHRRRSGQVPVFGSNGVVGEHNAAVTKSETVIIGRKGSFGEVAYSAVPCWPIDTAFYVDRTATDANLRWLAYRMANLGLDQINRSAAVPGLSRQDAYRCRLMLPPLSEQRRIAAVLDHADALRARRRAAIEELDQLARSIFLEMFGDPVTNPKDWPGSVSLGEVADVRSGITKGRKLRKGASSREVPYLAVVNVQDRALDLSTVKTIQATDEEIERYRLIRDDLLLTEGGDPDKVGRGTLWDESLPDCIHQNHVFRARVRCNEIHPVFLNWLVGSARGKRYFLKSAKQTTGIASINLTQLRRFPLLVPPIEVQRAFADRIAALDRLKATHRAHLAELDALFSSLQHRAFRGDL